MKQQLLEDRLKRIKAKAQEALSDQKYKDGKHFDDFWGRIKAETALSEIMDILNEGLGK